MALASDDEMGIESVEGDPLMYLEYIVGIILLAIYILMELNERRKKRR